MNKKLLFLLSICAFSVLAVSVFAGDTACGLGGCAAASVSSTSISATNITLQSSSLPINTLTWTAFCGNVTGKPCLNQTSPNLTVCNATTTTTCAANTQEILNQLMSNANVANFSYVAVVNKSANFAAIGYDSNAGVWKLFVGFKMNTTGYSVKTYEANTAVNISLNGTTANYNDAVEIDTIQLSTGQGILVSLLAKGLSGTTQGGDATPVLLKFDSTGTLLEQLGIHANNIGGAIPRDYRTPLGITIDDQNPSQFAHGWVNSPVATPLGRTFGIELDANPMNLATSTGNSYGGANGGLVISIHPTSYTVSRGGNTVTKDAVLAYTDTGGPTTQYMIASNEYPDNMNVNAIQISTVGFIAQDMEPLSGTHVINKDTIFATAINKGPPSASLITTKIDHSAATPVVGSGKNYSLILNTGTYGGVQACSGPNKANVKATLVDQNGAPYFLVFNSMNSLMASFSSSDSASRAADTFCINPAVHAVQLPYSTYNGTSQDASLIAVTQGSTLIDSFYVYNMTVDSGAVLQANADGGHSDDYIYYVLGGRSSNDTGVFLDYLNTSLGLSAVNPNGTTRFTTDKTVQIATYEPDINILNFQLDWQVFNGSFDTTLGLCYNCSYDGANDPSAGGTGYCQAEVEKIWGMFNNYNLTITLTVDTPNAAAINFSRLALECKPYATAISQNSNCSRLSPYTDTTSACFTPSVPAAYSAYASVAGSTVSINLTSFYPNLTSMPFGTISPTTTCEQIACEVTGEWQPGNTQEFTVNKTITVTAI